MDSRSERRLVTCLFVDIVGSTDTTVRLGPERVRRVLADAFDALSSIIAAQGGVVEKYVGDAVFALFGAQTGHADDALRALRAAQACIDWSEASDASAVPVALRIGAETGEALIDLAAFEQRERVAVGAVVNVAARLQQHADAGEILVGPQCHAAAAGEAGFEPAGLLDLKGLGQVEAWRFTAFLPPAHARLAFVGRDAELNALELVFDRARDGQATLALVIGPPGQGKSRLAEQAIVTFGAHRLIEARCRPGAESGSHTPLRQILDADVPTAAPDAVRDRLVALLGEDEGVPAAMAICHSAGIAADERILAVTRMEQRDTIAGAWRRYLAAVAGSDLLVLLVEDLHWGDPVLHRVLDRLTSDLQAPILVLGTARPELAGSSMLRPRPDAVLVELQPLGRAEAERLAAMAGREEAAERGGGNPLFIIELAQASAIGSVMPLTVQAAISARLDELGPFERRLIHSASVVGETFEIRDAALLTDGDPGHVAGGLARAAHLGCIVPVDGRFRFHHALVHDVAYGRLPVEERMTLHARYAAEGVDPTDVVAAAYHWWEAVNPSDAEWVWSDAARLAVMRRTAFEAQVEAGQRLQERNAYEQSVEVYQRALGLADEPEAVARAEAGLGLGYARLADGDAAWKHRLHAMEVLRASGTTPPARLYADTLEIATWNWGYFQHLPDDDEVLRMLDEGERAAAEEDDTVSLARLVVGRAAVTGAAPRSDMVERIVSVPDPLRFAEPLHRLATVLMYSGEISQAVKVFRWVLDELVPAGGVINEPEALAWAGLATVFEGDLGRADALAERLLEESTRRSAHTRQHAYALKMLPLIARGHWDDVSLMGEELRALARANPEMFFCPLGGAATGYEAIASVLRGQQLPSDLDAYLERLLTASALVRAASVMLPKVMAGEESALATGLRGYASDLPLRDRARVWDLCDVMPAIALTMLERWDALGPTLERLDTFAGGGSRLAAALAEAIREEQRAASGGVAPTHATLTELGFSGLSTLLRFRPPRSSRTT